MLATALLGLAFLQPPAKAQEPTATPFWNSTVEARVNENTIKRCLRYLPLVERWRPDFPEIRPELVFAVAAQESHCNHNAPSTDRVGSVGLMQVAPLSGRPTATRLAEPAVNVYWGMRILRGSIELADGDLRTGLAYYNCGVAGVEADRCGSKGGYAYADRVIDVWLPMARRTLGFRASAPLDVDQMLQKRGLLPTEAPLSTPTETPTIVPTATPIPITGSVDPGGGRVLMEQLLLAFALAVIGYGTWEIIRYLKQGG